MLNGWNEIPTDLLSKAEKRVNQLERDFFPAGILVATREHHFLPPLSDTLRLALVSLSESQRWYLVRANLPEHAEALLLEIENDQTLSEITRTPLILLAIIHAYGFERAIPRTRSGILQMVIRHNEESTEHRGALLSEPLWGRSNKYLTEIAVAMTREGRTTLSEESALKIISTVNKNLQDDGIIANLSDPKRVLDILCAHHLLDKSNYPGSSVKFIHHQFQEVYASFYLHDRMSDLIGSSNAEAMSNFQKEIINNVQWEEPLRLFAEHLGEITDEDSTPDSLHPSPLEIGKRLVDMTVGVDLMFAAELAKEYGSNIWDAVKGDLAPLLRKWYTTSSKAHQRCALAAMIATGSEDFADVIRSLLEHPDQRVRLETYRAPVTFYLSCLGRSWKQRVCSWEEDRREEFVGELSQNGELAVSGFFEELVMNDPSLKARIAALESFRWMGILDKFWQMLGRCDDKTLQEIVRTNHLPQTIPEELRQKIRRTYHILLKNCGTETDRLRLLQQMHLGPNQANPDGLSTIFGYQHLEQVLKM